MSPLEAIGLTDREITYAMTRGMLQIQKPIPGHFKRVAGGTWRFWIYGDDGVTREQMQTLGEALRYLHAICPPGKLGCPDGWHLEEVDGQKVYVAPSRRKYIITSAREIERAPCQQGDTLNALRVKFEKATLAKWQSRPR